MLQKILISVLVSLIFVGCVAKYDHRGFDPKSNMHSITKTAYDKEGYDIKGFDKDGFDKDGYDVRGFNRKGFDRRGYDKEGYNKDGFDIKGFNKEGFDREGFDDRGFNKNGLHKITKTKYDENGFDINGWPNIEDYRKRASDSFSQIFKEIAEIKKIDESLVQGEFEKKEEFQKRIALTKKVKLQKTEEISSKIFVFNTTHKENINRNGIIFEYSPDDEMFKIRMQEKIRVFHQEKDLGTYTAQNAYGNKVTVSKSSELSEILFFSNKQLSYADLDFYDISSYPFFFGSGDKKTEKIFNVPVKMSIAKSGNIKLQIYYKVHQSMDGSWLPKRIEPKNDYLYDNQIVNRGIRAILVGLAVLDGQSNLLHYEKI